MSENICFTLIHYSLRSLLHRDYTCTYILRADRNDIIILQLMDAKFSAGCGDIINIFEGNILLLINYYHFYLLISSSSFVGENTWFMYQPSLFNQKWHLAELMKKTKSLYVNEGWEGWREKPWGPGSVANELLEFMKRRSRCPRGLIVCFTHCGTSV